MRYPAFIGGSATSQASVASGERTINWYVEPLTAAGAKNAAALYPTPGTALFSAATGAAPVRALFQQNDRVFAVVGAEFVEVDAAGGRTVRGTVALDTAPATITANGDGGGQVFITSGDVGYCFDLVTNAFTTVRASGARMGEMVGGYFFALDAATSTVWASDLLDGTVWSGASIAQRSQAPDKWKALKALNGELFIFGQATTEIWYNAGASPFPFAAHPSGVIDFGVAADFSIARVGGALAWLAQTTSGVGQVVLASGFQPKVISTYELHAAMAGYSRIDDAIGQAYEERGHVFYVLYFPTAGATWAYDLTTGVWAERGTWIAETASYVAWRPLYHAYAFGKLLAGDRETGDIHHVSTAYVTDVDDRPIRRVRRAPSLRVEDRRIRFSKLELYLETGLGAVSGQGSNPLVELNVSNDGGRTWHSAGTRSAGRLGEYLTTVAWRRLGSGVDRQFELVVSDPVPWRIVDAFLKMRGAP
jgi:hypothetical protein